MPRKRRILHDLQSVISNLHSPISNLLLCALALLAACAPVAPPPTPTSTSTPVPTPTFTPGPTPTPSPTLTLTPIPPLVLTIRWPEQVSALKPVPIEVELVPPPGISITPTVRAAVVDSTGRPHWRFDLTPRQGNLYAAEEPLQLPLEPRAGYWRLAVYVQSALPVEGKHEVVFRPTSIQFQDLTNDLPAGVSLRLPLDFIAQTSQGDRWAGGRVWRYGGGELALWWAPGPVETLQLHNAVVMLEATHNPDAPARVLKIEETEWQGRTAFLFREDWPGEGGGSAEALVVQGSDYWLYVLRVRARGGGVIPPLMRQVWETFTFVEE